MKRYHKNFCTFLLSCLFMFSLALAITTFAKPTAVTAAAAESVQTQNVSFGAETYKTTGASIRLFETDGSPIEDGLSGIRFHVVMNKTLYEAHKSDENFRTYTVILPSYLLSGELTKDSANALILETTDVWRNYKKDETFVESVAFLYDLPVSQYATDVSFRGCVSLDGGATISYQTETSNRSMAFVAKAARNDVSAVLEDEVKESNRIATLNTYIPKYNVTYKVGTSTITERAEYGDKLSNVPQGISVWRNEAGEKVDVSAALTANTTDSNVREIVLTAYANVTVHLTNASATINGTAIPNGATVEVKCGDLPFSVLPINNHQLSSVNVNGASQNLETSRTLSVTGDTSIAITANIITYSVSLDNSGGASVSGTVSGTFTINSTCAFTLGKGFYKVTVNGTEIFPNTSRAYSFIVTANSVVKIVKLTDAETKAQIMNAIASASNGSLSVSGNTLVSPSNTGTITIGKAVFDELKKYGYSTLTFDIYKPQKKEVLYKKRIQNVTDGVTVAEVGIYKDSISASGVSISKATTFEGQYKSFGSWSGESVGVSWTLSNISFS